MHNIIKDLVNKKRRRQYPWIRQDCEEECGAACIAMIAKYYGKTISISVIRNLIGTNQYGSTLLGLRRGADEIGFFARALRTDPDPTFFDDIEKIHLPSVLHWQGNHWVVLFGLEADRVVIGDPALGITRIDREEFLEKWLDGVLLSLEPDLGRLLKQPGDSSKIHFASRILRLARPYKGLLIRAAVLNIILGAVGLGLPLLMQVLTDDILVRRDAQMLSVIAIAFAFIFVYQSILEWIEGRISAYFYERLELNLLLEYGYRLMRMPMAYFDTRRSGDVLNRIIQLQEANGMFNQLLVAFPSGICVATASTIAMLLYCIPLAIVAIISYIIVVVVQFLFLPAGMKVGSRVILKEASIQALLVEFFRSAQLIKANQAVPQAWQEFQSEFGELASLNYKFSKISVNRDTTVEFLSSMFEILILIYGSTFVMSGRLSIGQLLAFSAMGLNVLGFLRNSSLLFYQIYTDRSIFARLAEVFEGKLEEENASAKSWLRIDGSDSIIIKALSYAHPGRRNALANITTTIPGGVTTGIIGSSGCGKSSFVKLIAGLYPFPQGLIRYGLIEQGDVPLDVLRSQVSLVTQDVHLLGRSILDNFRFVHPESSYEEIVLACQCSMADSFIVDLPMGYRTILGEFGANLSGGQKQRLAIARALLGKPPILILDESTSALDPVSEAEVLDRVIKSREGLTTIIVSHRPSVIDRCTHLIYLDNGQIRFQGSRKDAANSVIPQLSSYLNNKLIEAIGNG
jgi:ABC-type bacteriocin/lantibiotic exporter with double-glycine peptidase domain